MVTWYVEKTTISLFTNDGIMKSGSTDSSKYKCRKVLEIGARHLPRNLSFSSNAGQHKQLSRSRLKTQEQKLGQHR